MTRLRLALLALTTLGAIAACDPDLPGRACQGHDDCFRDEICQGTSCVAGDRAQGEPEADAAVDAGYDAGVDAEGG